MALSKPVREQIPHLLEGLAAEGLIDPPVPKQLLKVTNDRAIYGLKALSGALDSPTKKRLGGPDKLDVFKLNTIYVINDAIKE